MLPASVWNLCQIFYFIAGDSTKKWGIISGVVVGAVLLLLLLFAWRWYRKSKEVHKGMQR